MMYNAETDRGRQVKLPLHSHYISGIMDISHILDYTPLYSVSRNWGPNGSHEPWNGWL